MNIVIRKSSPNDVHDIRKVERITWIDTYPNIDAGITTEDIKEKFENDSTPEGRLKIETKKKRYENPNNHIHVAVDKDKIIGFCWAETEEDNGRIMAIYLLPEY